VVVAHVVVAPHPAVRRHRRDQPAAGREPAGQRRQRGDVGLNVLDDVERRDQVKWRAKVRQPFRKQPRLDGDAGLRGGVGARFIIWLHGADLAEGPQHRQVAPGAAADLEDARLLGQLHPLDLVGQDLAPGGEPPVLLLDLADAAVDVTIHADCPCSALGEGGRPAGL
jgi:hypothetical protein